MELLQLQKQLFNSDTRIIYKKKSSMKLPNLKLTCKPQNLKEKKKKNSSCASYTIPRKSPTNGTSALTIQEVGSITCQT